jgi:hypothetical protein
LIANSAEILGLKQVGVINSGFASGIPRLRRTIPLLFEKGKS